MTDVETLRSQLLPTPLINESLYDVMGFEMDTDMLSPAECCGLVSFKRLNLKACLSE